MRVSNARDTEIRLFITLGDESISLEMAVFTGKNLRFIMEALFYNHLISK